MLAAEGMVIGAEEAQENIERAAAVLMQAALKGRTE